MNYKERAEIFLKETQFHLGDLTTEQSHPVTINFSDIIQRNTTEGIKLLLKVDEDITKKASTVFGTKEYKELKNGIRNILNTDGTIYFSGCGSTGRLAIILESLWRRFWNSSATKYPKMKKKYNARANRSYSILTGGDRALIKSVENFEDYITFGRRQTHDGGTKEKDLFIAVSEGGETSSVIGTALEAADIGAKVFFLYNNPDDILSEKVERSKNIIEDSRITTINLTTGPMALSGSTRMQATTMELFVIGTALESVCGDILANETGIKTDLYTGNREEKYIELYNNYLSQLMEKHNLEVLGNIVNIEKDSYEKGGYITYLSDIYLLDIFSDTTERSPTFMLPPFKKLNEKNTVNSWAFAKDPLNSTRNAWLHLLQREPRGLNWDSNDYKNMNSPQYLIDNPPSLDLNEIYSYKIGYEKDNSRQENGRLLYFDLFDGRSEEHRELIKNYYINENDNYELESHCVTINSPKSGKYNIELDLLGSEMYLFWHLFFKIILNSISTGTMGVMGRIQGNWMIQVDATNKKLIDRSCRIISSLKGVTYKDACYTLFQVMEENKKESRADNISYVLLAMDKIENRN